MVRSGDTHLRRLWVALVAALALVVAVGCGDNDDLSEGDIENLRGVGEERGVSLAAELEGMLAGAPPEVVIGNMAAVSQSINDGEIMLAELALARSNDADVIDLANLIIADHSTANQGLAQLLAAYGIAPIDNDVSEVLRVEASNEREFLLAVDDDGFDRTYVEGQIMMHAEASALLANTLALIPPGDFLEYLQTLLAAVNIHLAQAEIVGRDGL